MGNCALQEDIKEFLTGRNVEWEEVDDLAQVAGDVDVLYQTRIQKERFQASAHHSSVDVVTHNTNVIRGQDL